MDSEQFDLVFSGDLIRGADLQQSKLNLARLFKIPENKVDALFSGKPIVLKKGLDFATANKYRVAIKKAGCRVDLVEKVSEAAAPVAASAANSALSEPNPQSSPTKPSSTQSSETKLDRAQFGETPSAQKPLSPDSNGSFESPDTGLRSQQHLTTKPQRDSALPLPEVHEELQEHQTSLSTPGGVADAVPAFEIAPVGADVLAPDEKREFAPLNIDTSDLMLREPGADLLDESERSAEPTDTVPELHADIAPVGSDLLAESEKPHTEVLELDLSGLSLSEPGADLGEIKDEQPAKVPDVSHLSVE